MTASPSAFALQYRGKSVQVRPQLRDPGTRGAGVSPIGRRLYWLVSIDNVEHWTPFAIMDGQPQASVQELVLRWLEDGMPPDADID